MPHDNAPKIENLERYISLGLVYNTLELGLVSSENLLSHLLTNPVSDNTLIAYRHLLLKVPGNQHYYNGTHFLIKAAPEYGAIYCMSQSPSMIKPTPESDEVDVGIFVYKGVLLMQQQPILAHKIKIITDQILVQLRQSDITLAIRARSEKILGSISNRLDQNVFNASLEVDWLDRLNKHYVHTSNIPGSPRKICGFHKILMACQQKSTDLPEYWQKMSLRYKELLQGIFNVGKVLPNKELPNKIKSLFPDFFPAITESFTDKAWFIYQLPTYLQGYILGYPIHEKSPSREELNEALKRLSNLGVDVYVDTYIALHKILLDKLVGTSLGFLCVDTINCVNEKDTLEESIYSYSCLDIISVDHDNKRYFFSRPEFPTLIEKGRNHWTNLELSTNEIVLIMVRDALTQVFRLPTAVPMRDLLNNIEKYTPKISEGSHVYLEDPGKDTEGETLVLPADLSRFFFNLLGNGGH